MASRTQKIITKNHILQKKLPQYYCMAPANLTSGKKHENELEKYLQQANVNYQSNYSFQIPTDIQNLYTELKKRFDFLVKSKKNKLIIEAKFQDVNGTSSEKIWTSIRNLHHICALNDYKAVIVCGGSQLNDKFINVAIENLKISPYFTHVSIIRIEEFPEFISQWKANN